MKIKLNQVTTLLAVCIISILLQTCKKDILIPEKSNDAIALDNQNITSLSTAYQVGTFVSGKMPNGVANIQLPFHICSAADGNMFVSSPNSGGLIYRITPNGKVTRLAVISSTNGIKAGQNGTVYLTRIVNLYYPPSNVGSIIKIDKNNVVTNVPVGLPLNSPNDLAIGPDSTLYITDQFNYRIVQVKRDGTTTVLAGKTGAFGLVDGQGENARFNNLSSIRYANDGTLWVVDGDGIAKGAQTIRKVTLDGKVSTFFRLRPDQESFINDVAVTKRDKNFVISNNENAFLTITRSAVSDTSSLTQRKYQILHLSHDKVLTPITNLLTEGFQNGDALQATFRGPIGLTVNPNGIFVADHVNQAIRRIFKK